MHPMEPTYQAYYGVEQYFGYIENGFLCIFITVPPAASSEQRAASSEQRAANSEQRGASSERPAASYLAAAAAAAGPGSYSRSRTRSQSHSCSLSQELVCRFIAKGFGWWRPFTWPLSACLRWYSCLRARVKIHTIVSCFQSVVCVFFVCGCVSFRCGSYRAFHSWCCMASVGIVVL